MKSWVIILCLGIIPVTLISQDTIAGWTFRYEHPEESVFADLGLDVNAAIKLVCYSDTSGSYGQIFMQPGLLTPVSFSAACSGWKGGAGNRYWMITFDGSGYQDFLVSSRQSSDPDLPGPRDFILQFRILPPGTVEEWTDVAGGVIQCNSDWGELGSVTDLLLPPECNNPEGLVQLRWLMASEEDISGLPVDESGISLIDNIIIKGSKVAGYHPPKAPAFFSVFPNPATSFVNIRLNDIPQSLWLLDIQGKKIRSCFSRETCFQWSLTGLDNGVYYIVSVSEDGTFSQPVRLAVTGN
ncbi:MAG: T9SS type A sorting domain-containing protein [Bacteroidales bacterium]|nr:T9SS type A sorting domain-containing protein [Bacteroidales bacterium]